MERYHLHPRDDFGVVIPPKCIDHRGLLVYRENFESLPRSEWTPAEQWIIEVGRPLLDMRRRQQGRH